MPGAPPRFGQVDQLYPVGQGLGHLGQQARHQVGVGINDHDGVGVSPGRLLPQLVADYVVHQGGLAHAGAGHVEVVAAQQVFGEANLPVLARRGLAHQGAAAYVPGRREQDAGPGTFHQGRLVPLAGRVPQGGGFPHPQDAAFAEQSRAYRVEIGDRDQGFDAAGLEPGPGGMVVVAVGGGHRTQEFLRPLLPGAVGQHGDDLQLSVEGDAAHLLLDQQRVVDPAAGLLPAPPTPARHGQPQDGAGAQERRLEKLPVLDPQVAPEGRQRPGAQDGHGHPVQLEGLGVVGVGGVGPLLAGVLESLLLVGLGPVGAQGAQQQPGQDPLAGPQGGEGADYRQQGIGAGVQQVVVPEGAQRHVLWAAGTEGQAPGLLSPVDEDGVVVDGYLPDAGLGVVGGELLPDHLVVLAAGQQGHAVHVPGQLQGEGFGYGDGLEQVLHAQERPLPGAGRRHRQQRRCAPVAPVAEKEFLSVDIHG